LYRKVILSYTIKTIDLSARAIFLSHTRKRRMGSKCGEAAFVLKQESVGIPMIKYIIRVSCGKGLLITLKVL